MRRQRRGRTGASPVNANYGLLYNEDLRMVVEPISEEQARRQWETGGEPFEVVLGDPARPRVSIVCGPEDKVFAVYFYDDLLRRALSFMFAPSRKDPQVLFLEDITTWDWDSANKRHMDEATEIHGYEYREDGYVRHITDRAGVDHVDVEELRDVPLDINWEPMPRFGDWASLARYSRSRPVDAPENALTWPPGTRRPPRPLAAGDRGRDGGSGC